VKIRSRLAFLVGAASILFLSSWILTNASAQRQLTRAEDLLKLTDRGHGYGAELLAEYYKFEAKDNEKTLEILQSITGRARNARVYNKIAKVQIDMGRREDALKSIYKGLEIDSTWPELHLLAGVNWTILGHPEKGLPHLLTALGFDPGRPEIYHALANAYYRLDSLYKATLAFKEVLRLKPDYATVYFETSNAYRLMGQYDSALVYVKKGLRLNPNFPRGYKLLDLIKAGLAEQGRR
jgi:tetratricopeptide (TPR) repeat protein